MSKYKILISIVVLVFIGLGVVYSLDYYQRESGEATLNAKAAEKETEADKTEVSIVRRPGTVMYQIPGMEKVEVTKDIVYKVDGDEEQKMDVYYPLEDDPGNKPYPVILIHGRTSDRKFKDSEYFESWGKLVAAYGFASVTFGWRCNIAPEDISDLMIYVREHADELGINSKGISVIAFSAGVEDGMREVLSVDTGLIDSIVAYYGKLPISVLENKQGNELPPIFIAKAGLESHFSSDCNDEFLTKAAELKCSITEVLHPEGVHGFDVYTNGDKTCEIIKESLAFIDTNRRNDN